MNLLVRRELISAGNDFNLISSTDSNRTSEFHENQASISLAVFITD